MDAGSSSNSAVAGRHLPRVIALTFDDGPHPLHTQPVLDTLAKHGIHAAFFLLGGYVEQYPHIEKQIHLEGHQLALPGVTKFSKFVSQIIDTFRTSGTS